MAIYDIYHENPKAFDVLNILIAVRDNKTKFLDDYGNGCQMKDFLKVLKKYINISKILA